MLVEVPINPNVLRWAIDQSGFTRADVADRLGVSATELRLWEKGDASPSMTQFRTLADVLRRQAAVFFLSSLPAEKSATASLRHPPGITRNSLNVVERRYLRELVRTQGVLAWVLEETKAAKFSIPQARISDNPEDAARAIRNWLAPNIASQLLWKDAYEAFRAWRQAIEDKGIYVFLFPLGKDSARGMSVWHDLAPALAVNTAWNVTARIYTLFHELGHLVTRTDSACVGYTNALTGASSSIERWCEKFAASALIPREHLKQFLVKELRWNGKRTAGLNQAASVARRYKVSLRAAVLAVIEVGAAERSLYSAIPNSADEKSKGGGGRPRTRNEISEDRFGARARATLIGAMREDLITRGDVLSYLHVGDEAPSSTSNNA